jgi:hypothetical protein
MGAARLRSSSDFRRQQRLLAISTTETFGQKARRAATISRLRPDCDDEAQGANVKGRDVNLAH